MKTAKLFLSLLIMLVLLGVNQLMGQWAPSGSNIYNTNTGNVGIGNSTPATLLHVGKNMTEPTIRVQNLGGPGGATYQMYDNVSGADWKFKATNSGGFKIRDNAHAMDVFQIESGSIGNAIYIRSGGNVGIHNNTPDALLDILVDDNHWTMLGTGNDFNNFFYHFENPANGVGQSTIYAKRTRSASSQGAGYDLSLTNQAIEGYTVWGDLYNFGIAGHNYNDYTRCGGVLGAASSGNYWGSLGYKTSGSTTYGGYFSSFTSGAGKSGQPASVGIGIGAWGDLFGADIHGKVYGTYTEGKNYALFSNGVMYKNDLDVHLQENPDGTNTPLYTNVSADVTIMTAGAATLSGGRASIVFDRAFSESVSAKEPVIVTVTPIGGVNAVSLSEVTSTGFKVVELNSGKSNITVNYIAIGKRAGYENPQLAKEVIDAGYTNKLERGLHNDNDLQTNGEGLYYENGQLVVGIHPSTLPDPNKKVEQIVEKDDKQVFSGTVEAGRNR